MWCWHKWEVVAFTPIDVYSGFGGEHPIKCKTEISMRCKKCGWPRVHTVRGNWSPGKRR